MNDVISEYQRWKQQGESLRAQARQAMESRYRDLLTQAAQLAEEYRADFGVSLKPPPPITAFRYKAGGRAKVKKAPRPKEAAAPPPAPKSDPRVAGLQKKLETARKKLEAARAGGAPTRSIEDRIYELEDELRLATTA